MLTQLKYVTGWIVLLLMAALLVAAWMFPQAVMTGVPRPVLIVLGLLTVAVILASLVMRKR
jgi:hypothetical protein